MSQRTDGGPSQPVRDITGGDYGDNQELRTLQQSAPMAKSGVSQTQGQWTNPQPSAQPPGDLFRGSERPNEPLTEGAPFGPGAGPRYGNGVKPTNSLTDTLEKLLQYDTNGDIENLYIMAKNRGW